MNRIFAALFVSIGFALAKTTETISPDFAYLRYAVIAASMSASVWFFGRATEQVSKGKLTRKDWLVTILESIQTGLIAGGFVGIINKLQPDWDIAMVAGFGTFIGTLGPSSKRIIKQIGGKMFGNDTR